MSKAATQIEVAKENKSAIFFLFKVYYCFYRL